MKEKDEETHGEKEKNDEEWQETMMMSVLVKIRRVRLISLLHPVTLARMVQTSQHGLAFVYNKNTKERNSGFERTATQDTSTTRLPDPHPEKNHRLCFALSIRDR